MLAVDDRNRSGPARGCALDLDRKAGNGESGWRQKLKIVQLLQVAITDMASRLVSFPDQAGVLCLGVFLGRVNERRIPAPAIDAGQADAAFEQMPQPELT
jgi:hypothetical protein